MDQWNFMVEAMEVDCAEPQIHNEQCRFPPGDLATDLLFRASEVIH